MDRNLSALRARTRALLAEARKVSRRYARQSGADDLHQLRIRLRRLQAALKVLSRIEPASTAEKTLQTLDKTLASTSAARDTEVRFILLRQLGGGPPFVEKAFLAELNRESKKLRRRWPEKFSRLDGALRKELNKRPLRAIPTNPKKAAEKILRKETKRLERALDSVSRRFRRKKFHRARIQAKELRYTLEILRKPAAAKTLKRLRKLQGTFGNLHDGELFNERVSLFSARLKSDAAFRPLKKAAKKNNKQHLRDCKRLLRKW